MQSRGGQQALVAGRVVLVRNSVVSLINTIDVVGFLCFNAFADRSTSLASILCCFAFLNTAFIALCTLALKADVFVVGASPYLGGDSTSGDREHKVSCCASSSQGSSSC
jgi:hypothetical protein